MLLVVLNRLMVSFCFKYKRL